MLSGVAADAPQSAVALALVRGRAHRRPRLRVVLVWSTSNTRGQSRAPAHRQRVARDWRMDSATNPVPDGAFGCGQVSIATPPLDTRSVRCHSLRVDREHEANIAAVKAADRKIARIKREMKKLMAEMARG